jgi:hypothetical protein
MPYILVHQDTMEIAASTLRNIYDIDYYGAQWWPTEEEALQIKANYPGWQIKHVTDMKLKMMNVKLNNDTSRKVFINEDGALRVETSSAD